MLTLFLASQVGNASSDLALPHIIAGLALLLLPSKICRAADLLLTFLVHRRDCQQCCIASTPASDLINVHAETCCCLEACVVES